VRQRLLVDAFLAASRAGDLEALIDVLDPDVELHADRAASRSGRASRSTPTAWRTKPSWYLVATGDRILPRRRSGPHPNGAGSTVVEVAGSHAFYVSQPAAVAVRIEQAASAVAPE
jgi:Alpha/beta hydrolase family